jgi:hypothetical protein
MVAGIELTVSRIVNQSVGLTRQQQRFLVRLLRAHKWRAQCGFEATDDELAEMRDVAVQEGEQYKVLRRKYEMYANEIQLCVDLLEILALAPNGQSE